MTTFINLFNYMAYVKPRHIVVPKQTVRNIQQTHTLAHILAMIIFGCAMFCLFNLSSKKDIAKSNADKKLAYGLKKQIDKDRMAEANNFTDDFVQTLSYTQISKLTDEQLALLTEKQKKIIVEKTKNYKKASDKKEKKDKVENTQNVKSTPNSNSKEKNKKKLEKIVGGKH